MTEQRIIDHVSLHKVVEVSEHKMHGRPKLAHDLAGLCPVQPLGGRDVEAPERPLLVHLGLRAVPVLPGDDEVGVSVADLA